MPGILIIVNDILCKGCYRDWDRAIKLNIIKRENYPDIRLKHIFEKHSGEFIDDDLISYIFYEWKNYNNNSKHEYGLYRIDDRYIFIDFSIGINGIDDSNIPVYDISIVEPRNNCIALCKYHMVMPKEMGEIINELKI